MNKLRIFLADDHAVLREGLAALINAQPDMQVIDQVGTGDLVVQQVGSNRPDIAVIDISMPGKNGAEVADELRQACPDTRVVVLTRHSEPAYVQRMLQAGVGGYVLKQAASTELLAAIRAAAKGETYLDRSITSQVVQKFIGNQSLGTAVREYQLSDRETSVVRLTAYGHSNKEIAAQLGLSVKTVETYKTRAMEKLNLRTRVEVVRYALEQGWFE